MQYNILHILHTAKIKRRDIIYLKKSKDYKEEYNDFWKSIVENEDGTLNKDQVMRELSDYSMVMENCAFAYSTMTQQRISKQNTMFFEVESIFYDLFIDKQTAGDDLVNNVITKDMSYEEIIKEIREYFDYYD